MEPTFLFFEFTEAWIGLSVYSWHGIISVSKTRGTRFKYNNPFSYWNNYATGFSELLTPIFVWFRSSAKQLENRLHSKYAGIIPYSKGLLDEDPLEKRFLEDFDLIITNHVLQAICTNMGDYTKALKQLKSYLKPGGHICILDPLEETYAKIGNVKFKNYPLVYDEVIKSFREAGLEIVNSSKKAIIADLSEGLPVDSRWWHLTLARKVWRLPANIYHPAGTSNYFGLKTSISIMSFN